MNGNLYVLLVPVVVVVRHTIEVTCKIFAAIPRLLPRTVKYPGRKKIEKNTSFLNVCTYDTGQEPRVHVDQLLNPVVDANGQPGDGLLGGTVASLFSSSSNNKVPRKLSIY